MNHGAKFYARLRAILPNLAELNKALKIEEKRVKSYI
jgi:predicted metal-dependent hydrolase